MCDGVDAVSSAWKPSPFSGPFFSPFRVLVTSLKLVVLALLVVVSCELVPFSPTFSCLSIKSEDSIWSGWYRRYACLYVMCVVCVCGCV